MAGTCLALSPTELRPSVHDLLDSVISRRRDGAEGAPSKGVASSCTDTMLRRPTTDDVACVCCLFPDHHLSKSGRRARRPCVACNRSCERWTAKRPTWRQRRWGVSYRSRIRRMSVVLYRVLPSSPAPAPSVTRGRRNSGARVLPWVSINRPRTLRSRVLTDGIGPLDPELRIGFSARRTSPTSSHARALQSAVNRREPACRSLWGL